MQHITSTNDPVHKAMMQRLDNGWRHRIGGYTGLAGTVSSLEQAQKRLNTRTIPFLRKAPGRLAMVGAGGILGAAGMAKLVDHIHRSRKEKQIREQAEQMKAI